MNNEKKILPNTSSSKGKSFQNEEVAIEIVKALFNLNIDKFKNLITEYGLDPYLLKTTPFNDHLYYPIYFISLAWDTYLHSDTFHIENRESFININNQIKEIFINQFKVDFSQELDFSEFQLWQDEDTIETEYSDDELEFIYSSLRDIDIKLYESAMKIKFDKVKECLEQGANPDAIVYIEKIEDYPQREYSILDEIKEYSTDDTALFFSIKDYLENINEINVSDLHYFFAYVGIQRVYDLMLPYSKEYKQLNI